VDSIRLGYQWNPKSGRTGKPVTFDLSSHLTLLGPTRCGKGVSLEIVNLLLGLHKTSIVSVDPTGQNASVCAEARRRASSKVLPVNPQRLHVDQYPDLESVGCNPMLAGVDPKSPRFFEEAAAIGEAMISPEGDSQRHFPESARGLITGLIMWVRLRDGDNAHLGTVLHLLTEAEELDTKGQLVKGLRRTAAEMVASGHFQIASLAGRFIKDGSREIDSIRSTAETQTRWLLSEPMRIDLAKNGIDWAQLTRTPTTVFVILPAEDLEFHSVSTCTVSLAMS
jgi:type IV secretion system protein VirD4